VYLSKHQDSKIVSIEAVKEKKLMYVEVGELPHWISMQDFTPKGIVGALWRGYYKYYKCIIVGKETSLGLRC
jgi:F-type H+-transporting ATPase subunit f